MHSLPLFARLAGRPVILLGDGPAADAKRRLLLRAGARVVGEGDAAALAIVAIQDAGEAAAAAARLQARGCLVNVVDRPEQCDFTLPAIVERGAVLVAVGTGGASAGLAAALRQRLETLLPPGLGALADALRDAREGLRARFPAAVARRRAIGALLAPGGPCDPLGPLADPAGGVAAALRDAPAPDRIERVAVASPDPDELTLRAARLLGQADRLYHPADMPAALLDRARADAERHRGAAPAAPGPGLTVELAWA